MEFYKGQQHERPPVQPMPARALVERELQGGAPCRGKNNPESGQRAAKRPPTNRRGARRALQGTEYIEGRPPRFEGINAQGIGRQAYADSIYGEAPTHHARQSNAEQGHRGEGRSWHPETSPQEEPQERKAMSACNQDCNQGRTCDCAAPAQPAAEGLTAVREECKQYMARGDDCGRLSRLVADAIDAMALRSLQPAAQGWAVFGPDGTVMSVTPEDSEEYAWQEFTEGSNWRTQKRTPDDWKSQGYTCERVTITKEGK